MIKRKNIDSIHQLRGIAALLVVFFHFRFFLNDVYAQKDLGYILFGGGAFGVDLFFMISGFIIAASTVNQRSIIVFNIRRFFRIYPTFIVTFAFGYLALYHVDPIELILRSLFFIHRDYKLPSPGFGYNLLGPAWTLTYEIYFYALFSVAMLINHRYRVFICSLLILLPFIIVQTHFNGEVLIAGTAAPKVPEGHEYFSLLRFVGSPILIEFVIGMFLYIIYSTFSLRIGKEVSSILFYLCVSLAVSFYFKPNHSGFGMQDFGFWALILLCGCLLYEKNNEVKQSKALNFLGDISFSLYISHYPIIYSVSKYNDFFPQGFVGISKFMLLATVCISFATLLHIFIERPFIKIGKAIEARITSTKL